jgi:CheY-like chemotaxis protein
MKFRIIWIDDSTSWVNSICDEIKEAFEKVHFTPIIEKFVSVNHESREAIDSNYLDLLIIDCNLPGTNGNEFIQELRGNRCFSHIVFYSEDAKNLSLVQHDDHFSHVTPRSNFSDVIEQVADQAYRKYNHPSFMRGLLLSEFIDLESLLDDLISQCFKAEGAYFRESIINKGGESFSLSTKQKFIARLIKDSKDKCSKTKATLEAIEFTSNGFFEKIIKSRNILAHAHPLYNKQTGEITLKSAIGDVDFTGDWFFETRNSIHEFKNKVKRLMSLNLIEVVNP